MARSPELPIFSVSDFIAVLNQTLEYSYPIVEIEGEVASYKVNQSKYVFFDLKDDQGSIGCFMTVWQLRMPIEDGMKVIISASPKLTNWGKFSLTVKALRPSGQGAIKKSFELLKAKLETEGLFSPDRKRNLPQYPQRVAVISSTDAAGYADFIKILGDRWGGLKVEVAHVQVQGSGASDQIIRAIDYFNQQESLADVLVIVRGGGSADDLSTFNDELLARSIAASRIPTLVGVGHEVDVSLADLVADVRASTPSNAAQILVPDKHSLITMTRGQIGAILPQVQMAVDQSIDNLKQTLEALADNIDRKVDDRVQQVKSLADVLAQLDPNRVLSRGYAILHGSVAVGSNLSIETDKQLINAEVKDVQSK